MRCGSTDSTHRRGAAFACAATLFDVSQTMASDVHKGLACKTLHAGTLHLSDHPRGIIAAPSNLGVWLAPSYLACQPCTPLGIAAITHQRMVSIRRGTPAVLGFGTTAAAITPLRRIGGISTAWPDPRWPSIAAFALLHLAQLAWQFESRSAPPSPNAMMWSRTFAVKVQPSQPISHRYPALAKIRAWRFRCAAVPERFGLEPRHCFSRRCVSQYLPPFSVS